MVEFFKNDKRFDHFKEVRLWDKSKDLGIDIIAYDGFGEPYAVQCKCYADDAKLHYEGNVTNLWTESEAQNIKNRLIVTTGIPTTNLVKQCEKTDVTIIRRTDLEDSKIKWNLNPKKITRNATNVLYKHQDVAYKDCIQGFQTKRRGQLIMACGTGKTLTSLRIAEKVAGRDKTVLYLVPSISLIKQTYNEWAENSDVQQQTTIVCSDKTAGNPEDISMSDLPSGIVTTDPDKLKRSFSRLTRDKKSMRVVFSTYQSANVIQEAFRGTTFDLIIFDEAHRTAGRKKKAFTLAHDDENIVAKKRLYMTATPRIYERDGKDTFSMDNNEIFGPVFHRLRFSKAIEKGILSDYQVVGFAIDAEEEDKKNVDVDVESEIPLEEECKLASVYGAIRQQDVDRPPNVLNRVLVFCNKIPNSKRFKESFKRVVEIENKRNKTTTKVETRHVDGKDRAKDRMETINWLKNTPEGNVHVLSNVRCLSEGVDVPSLDGVVFYEPRQSVVDVVQAVGRVMRKHPGKKMGYVIVPIVVSRNEFISISASKSKVNKLILQILEALRAHDDRIDKFFNQASLVLESGEQPSRDKIEGVIDIPPTIEPLFDVLPATLLNTGFYWEEYGRKLGERAAAVALRLTNRADSKYKKRIDALHNNLKETVGYTVTRRDTIEAVAQHVVLQPIFKELFGETINPVIIAFDNTVKLLDFHVELKELKEWHKLMKYHIDNINSPKAKQTIITKIYGNFFQTFDKAQAKTIVYTPVEIVDFIINSIQYILKEQFNTRFDNKKISILDPFAGTGIFLTRLMDILPKEKIKFKYNDIGFDENKLLAYYTACTNIEASYSRITTEDEPFKHSCYVDTFTVLPNWRELKAQGRVEANEQQKITDPDFKNMYQMLNEQRSTHTHIIMANPPYSAGRKSANEDNININHPEIEKRIKKTYASKIPHITQKRSLYNLYIKALRWASDRIGKSGIIGFITPSAYIRGNTEAGIRACLKEEFTDVYCFDLRGNVRQVDWHREGGKIFGGGSTTGVAITILIKNPNKKKCTIHYKDIGDYLSQEEKLNIIRKFASIDGIHDWQIITPDKNHDWLDQPGPIADEWEKIPPLGSKAGKSGKTNQVLFSQYAPGVGTGRDDWSYNSSLEELTANMKRHINYYNSVNLNDFPTNTTQAKKSEFSISRLKRLNKKLKFNKRDIRVSLYRPFFKQYFHYEYVFIARPRVISLCFSVEDSENLAIIVPDKIKGEHSTFITDVTPDLHIHEASQVFPLKTVRGNEETRKRGNEETRKRGNEETPARFIPIPL